jgi:hypothetical protein
VKRRNRKFEQAEFYKDEAAQSVSNGARVNATNLADSHTPVCFGGVCHFSRDRVLIGSITRKTDAFSIPFCCTRERHEGILLTQRRSKLSG